MEFKVKVFVKKSTFTTGERRDFPGLGEPFPTCDYTISITMIIVLNLLRPKTSPVLTPLGKWRIFKIRL